MAEKKSPEPQVPADQPPAAAPLGDAGASSNPLVHQALAARDIAVQNGDDDAVKAADAWLAELGVA